MQAIDYLKFLDTDHVCGAGVSQVQVHEIYGNGSGVAYKMASDRGHGIQEVVRLQSNLLLVLGEFSSNDGSQQHQIVRDGDWIHIQFRLRGGGEEQLEPGYFIETASNSCVIARYPDKALIERNNRQASQWRAACLYFRPNAVRGFFGISPAAFSSKFLWLHDDEACGPEATAFPLSSREHVAASDLFSCDLRGDLRRSYMQAKAIELFTLAMSRCVEHEKVSSASLSELDAKRVSQVRQILMEEIGFQLSLGQLARRVGVNRSKLAMGFKELYGVPLQAYWREMRLCRARELLMADELSVADVATAVGYADTSSLTRSFHAKFGVLPKDCKRDIRPS